MLRQALGPERLRRAPRGAVADLKPERSWVGFRRRSHDRLVTGRIWTQPTYPSFTLNWALALLLL